MLLDLFLFYIRATFASTLPVGISFLVGLLVIQCAHHANGFFQVSFSVR